MKVAAYQAPLLESGSIEAAVALIAEQVRICATAGVRILCCPEAVLGGLADYSIRPHDLAIDVPSGRLEKLLAPIASDAVTTIVGFTEAGANGTLFNSAAVFSNGEVTGVYRKNNPAIRRSVYSPGEAAPVFEIDEGKFGIVICLDSTYPDLVRSVVQRGARTLFVPTNNGLPPDKGGIGVVHESRETDVSRTRDERCGRDSRRCGG